MIEIAYDNLCPVLTAYEAIALAEEAFMAGQQEIAVGYVNVAYAIFDENAARWSNGPPDDRED